MLKKNEATLLEKGLLNNNTAKQSIVLFRAVHLHRICTFEVYDANDNLIYPYGGNCNSINTQSWWADQENYYEPTVNTILTHNAAPLLGCFPSRSFKRYLNYLFKLRDDVHKMLNYDG